MHLTDAQEDLDEIRALPGKKLLIRGNHDYWWEATGKLNRMEEAAASGCDHTILLLHYPPVCDLTKPSGFTELLEKYEVPLCIFGHLHGMQPNTMFPRMYNGTLLHLVSADYRDCQLLEIKFDEKGAPLP